MHHTTLLGLFQPTKLHLINVEKLNVFNTNFLAHQFLILSQEKIIKLFVSDYKIYIYVYTKLFFHDHQQKWDLKLECVPYICRSLIVGK